MLFICPKLGPPKFMSLVTNHRIALFRPVVLQLLRKGPPHHVETKPIILPMRLRTGWTLL